MTTNCDYVYVQGLRFETGNIEVHVPVNTPEEGPVNRRNLEYRSYRLTKPDNRATSITEDTISVEMLKKIVGRGASIPCSIVDRTGKRLTRLQLDPFRCEGRSGRRAFSAEKISESLHTDRLRVAREQLRTLPYGRNEARGAVERLTWAIRSIPDGEVGAMVLSGDAPHLPGMLTRGRILELFADRREDVALILAAMPSFRTSLELSAEEADTIEHELKALVERMPGGLPSFRRHADSWSSSPLDNVTDPMVLQRIALLAVTTHTTKEAWGDTVADPRHVTIDALWRLGKLRAVVEYDMQARHKDGMGAEYRRNLAYASVFGGASLTEVQGRIAEATATVFAALRDAETIAMALASPVIAGAALDALGEDEVRRLVETVREHGSEDALRRIAANTDERFKALLA